ncbi:DeoR/GlpR transcriptional regulator [Hanamia caeni]|uniref:DeoR/GlpR transcriptional regulator n=1 Tax=Hanamia caeni TaxID=2294116 RepID=A0A3M9NCS6_9BACT|nr:DeoR/GlpR family DNA-binding transcription regulator [Hanamia caeni]RNI34778.1 DeoR/GlpR transcriptional regulator [Hanamia caeni]
MSSVERHQKILEMVQAKGYESVINLCKKLKVSAVTVRKDLKLLEKSNKLFRIHGGASNTNPFTADRPVNEKENLQREEKKAIAIKAAQYIEPNDSIIIASGTSLLALAREIKPSGKLTVITSAIQVAGELVKHTNIDVLQLGGLMRHSSSSVVGSYAENILSDFFCTKLFLGVDGIDFGFGVTTSNSMEAQLNKQMMQVVQKVIVLADHTKFGKRGFSRICGLDEIDEIITDKNISPAIVEKCISSGIKVTLV